MLELFSTQRQRKVAVKNDGDIFYNMMGSYANYTMLDREITQLAEALPSYSFSTENFLLYEHKYSRLDAAFFQKAKAVFKEKMIGFNGRDPEGFNSLIANITATVPSYPKAKIDLTSIEQFFLSIVHLKATWSTPFLANLTALQRFYIENGDRYYLPSDDDRIHVDNNCPEEGDYYEDYDCGWFRKKRYTLVHTMQVYAYFPYTEHDKWTLIDLPLRAIGSAPLHRGPHDDYIMTIVLPRNDHAALIDITKKLDWWSIVSRQIETVPSRYLHLHMPRFCINNFIQFDNPSDQGEILETNKMPLFQQVGIRVQEGGIGVNAAQVDPIAQEAINRTLVVKINRSFFYLIWHPKTQLTLLAGWVRHFYTLDNSNRVDLCLPLDQ